MHFPTNVVTAVLLTAGGDATSRVVTATLSSADRRLRHHQSSRHPSPQSHRPPAAAPPVDSPHQPSVPPTTGGDATSGVVTAALSSARFRSSRLLRPSNRRRRLPSKPRARRAPLVSAAAKGHRRRPRS